MQEHRGTIVSCWIALLAILLAQDGFANLTIKLAFVIIAGVVVFLYFRGISGSHLKMKYTSYFLAAGLFVAVVVYTVLPDGPSGILKWGKEDFQEETISELSPRDIYQQNRENTSQALESLRGDVEQASKELEKLNNALKAEVSSSKETYLSEVQELGKVLAGKQSLIDSSFPNMKTDEKELELFYKTQLYEEIRHYSSFVSALEEYGVECANMGINECTLMLWDVENLYIFYGMKKELELGLLENEWYESKDLEFNSYKVAMNQYSDLLNYGSWRFTYENQFAKDLEKIFDGFIMNYYKRFHLNFEKQST